MNEEVEDYLGAMAKHLVKMQKHKNHYEVFLIPQETSQVRIFVLFYLISPFFAVNKFFLKMFPEQIDLGKAQTFSVTLVAQDTMKGDMSLVR